VKFVIGFFLIIRNIYPQVINVQQLNSEFDTAELKNKSIQIHHLNEYNGNKPEKKLLPNINLLYQLIKKADLENEFSSFDQLEKDKFFIRALSFDFKKVAELYPELPQDKLKKLISLINDSNVKVMSK
jgi:hypothetical protein